MRQVVLDTETTGLEPELGHRIIEIGCIELCNRRITGRHFHRYLNPQRDIDAGATQVHGIQIEDLQEQPVFADIAAELLEFIRDAEIIMHNAPFDVAFLNHELQLADPALGTIADRCTVIDTLVLARQLHPGQRNNLDALCKRYAVDNSHRELHGALLDAEILAEVYLAMTGGQASLWDEQESEWEHGQQGTTFGSVRTDRSGRVVLPTVEDLARHEARLRAIDQASGGGCLWRAAVDRDLSNSSPG
ncbi:MAG: DNA polymerase III subunit epsilon [Gammaproteobacteria bacterium]|nr:DNA polymerase III subunit epsilon [Gammaproteobacteria bacterium]